MEPWENEEDLRRAEAACALDDDLDDVSGPPVRLCCGQPHRGVACPDGKIMCCICFYRFEQDELHVDTSGTTWDICKECGPQVDG